MIAQLCTSTVIKRPRSHAVAKAQRYKAEGRGWIADDVTANIH